MPEAQIFISWRLATVSLTTVVVFVTCATRYRFLKMADFETQTWEQYLVAKEGTVTDDDKGPVLK